MTNRIVHVVGVAPPPVNGMTLVTSQIAQRLDRTGRAHLRMVSGTLRGLRWTARKHAGFLFQLTAASLRARGRERCYFVPDSGNGLWINIPEALILRFGFGEVWLHHHVFSYVRKYDPRMALILRLLGPKARHIVLGDAMAKGLAQHYGASHFAVLNNAGFVTDAAKGRVRNALSCVGFLGNITRAKGIMPFMDTLRQLQTDDSSISALIAGPIPDPGVQQKVAAFCAERPDARQWIGAVKGAEKREFFEQIDALLFPTLYENEALPVTIYEALAAGVPVLATDRGCIGEQLSGLGCVLSERGFAAAAAARLAQWHASPDNFATASSAALAQYRTQLVAARTGLEQLVHEITRDT